MNLSTVPPNEMVYYSHEYKMNIKKIYSFHTHFKKSIVNMLGFEKGIFIHEYGILWVKVKWVKKNEPQIFHIRDYKMDYIHFIFTFHSALYSRQASLSVLWL